MLYSNPGLKHLLQTKYYTILILNRQLGEVFCQLSSLGWKMPTLSPEADIRGFPLSYPSPIPKMSLEGG